MHMNILNLFKKKDAVPLKLVCFDLDNTLCEYDAAEAETEAYIADMIYADFLQHKKHPARAKKAKTVRQSKSSTALTLSAILKAFNESKHAHMHKDLEPEQFSRGLWLAETLQKLPVTITPARIKTLSAAYEKAYWDFLIPKLKLYPHTLETLQALKNKGIITACLTDSDGEKGIKIRRMVYLGLDKYLDFIITTDDTKKNKPAIENWEYLLKAVGVLGKECMMVGDHPDIDLLVPKGLGFRTVWTKEHFNTSTHFKYVDHEIHHISDVEKIAKKYA